MASFGDQFRDALAPEFLVEGELGRGGQGTVFLAYDPALARRVAIKTLRAEDASASAMERFQVEAQTLAKLRHPHIVPVHASGTARGLGIPYYVMDFLDGETLEHRLTLGPMAPNDAVRLGVQLLDALTLAHRNGVIHRDIKPSNVFLENGVAILTDFGIAKRLDQAEQRTQEGALVGTWKYASPEQRVGMEVTPQSDLYSVGLVLYEALTTRVWADEPPEAPSWRDVSLPLRRVIRRAVATETAPRWPDAEAFKRGLVDAEPWPTVTRWTRRTVIAAVSLAIATKLLGIPLFAHRSMSDLRIERLTSDGPDIPPLLGDSIASLVARKLSGFPDFTVLAPDRSGRA